MNPKLSSYSNENQKKQGNIRLLGLLDKEAEILQNSNLFPKATH